MRVAIAEDSVLLRKGLILLIEEAGHEVVGTLTEEATAEGVDKATGGRYHEKIDSVHGKVGETLHRVRSAPAPGSTADPAADAEEPGRLHQPAAALIGDAKPILQRLLEVLPAHNARRAPRKPEMEGRQAAWRKKLDDAIGPHD